MICGGQREKLAEIREEQKWDYIVRIIPVACFNPPNQRFYRISLISSQHHGSRLSPIVFFISLLWSQLPFMEWIHLPQQICFSSTAGPARSSLQYRLTFQSGSLPAVYYFPGYSSCIGG